jgi:predicted NAD/FAD-dependent oxidoreductase
LAKKLAAPLNISYNLKVQKLEKQSDHWRVSFEEGEPLDAQQVVLTCPLPQSLEILNRSGISFAADLVNIHYQKAVVLLLRFDAALETEMIYSENVDKNIFSICSQQAKGLGKQPDYTFVMQEPWTNTHFDRLDGEIAQAAHAIVSQKFPRPNILNLQVKKWRYAQPTRIWNQFFENPAPSLYLAGDAFGGASLNGALKSSNSLAEYLKKFLVAKCEHS